jgi:hypothetical protein
MKRRQLLGLLLLAIPLVYGPVSAQTRSPAAPRITTPKEAFGFNVGDDYHMASYTQLEAYWKKVAAESDRMKLVDIGLTPEGRHQYMAVLSSPENLRKLEHYRDISKRLAVAEGLSDDQAHALAREGKAVIFMDGGLHATETVGSQTLIELVYQMVSRTDEETLRLLNDDIILLCLANPDGMELVANWYMREPDVTKRALNIPRLYQHYIGHDNARDLYMSNQMETININKVLFIDWFPQITHTHHQTGPAGAVVFMPPFRDPFNYDFDPLVITELDLVGAAMHSRMIAAGLPGTAMKGAANYSTWFNGAMRTVSYFHNAVGLLTEIIGNPTPMEIPLVLERQLPNGNEPFPVAPGPWHYRQSIDYAMEYSRAVFDVASRYRETFLFNRYRMGKNSIERGSRDTWTVTPKRIAAAESAAVKMGPQRMAAAGGEGGGRGAATIPAEIYKTVLHDPKLRDARGYVIPSDQPDFSTATKFINVLLKNGIEVLKATSSFAVAGKSYPANSFVVQTAQASRPFVMGMFEPQDHPNDFRYAGGPPIPPYDITGWTPAFAMGVQFDRYQDGFTGPFTRVEGVQAMPPGAITGPTAAAGFLVSHRINNAIILVNRLLKNKAEVYWLKSPTKADGEDLGVGAIWVPASAAATAVVERGARELGLPVHRVAKVPIGESFKLQPIRIALTDQYGGNIPSGWMKWMFEQYEFPFDVVYPEALDAGNLRSKYDVLVMPDGSARFAESGRGRGGGAQPSAESIPAEFREWLGTITAEKTVPQIRKFVESGGSLVALGSSTTMAELLGVPVRSYLTEKTPDGRTRPLPQEKYYIPGSLLKVTINNTNPLAYGMGDKADVMFDNSPVFRLDPSAESKRTSAVAWFSGPKLVSSGWAWGEQYLDGGTAIVDASLGDGKVFLFGPEVAFRGQAHGTFKFLFNGLYYGSAKPMPTQAIIP